MMTTIIKSSPFEKAPMFTFTREESETTLQTIAEGMARQSGKLMLEDVGLTRELEDLDYQFEKDCWKILPNMEDFARESQSGN
jgi:hypothetical protein